MFEMLPAPMMITALHVLLGITLGALGAIAHLAITRWRAKAVVDGRPLLAWLSFPLGLLVIGAALIGAARIANVAAWSFVVGVFVARSLILARAKKAT